MRLKISRVVPVTAFVLGFGIAVASPLSAAFAQQERIYGSQLMTERERNEYRTMMGAATSNEERERIRWDHHLRMQERAEERGVNLPEAPMFGMHQGPGRAGDGQGRPRLPKGGGGKRGS